MRVQSARSVEVRGFAADQYYASGLNLMPGTNSPFIAEALVRVTDLAILTEEATQYQLVFGNISGDTNLSGYAIVVVPNGTEDDVIDGQRTFNIGAFVYDGLGGVQGPVAQLSFANVLGKTMLLTLVWTGTVVLLYLNGALVASDSTGAITVAPSSGRATIGSPSFDTNEAYAPLTTASVLGALYADNGIDVTPQIDLDHALAAHFLETMKRGYVVSTIDDGVAPNGVDYVLNVGTPGPISGVYPSTITNLGVAAPAGGMTKQGAGTTLVATAAQTDWASVVCLIPAP